ncbi:cell division protein FtsX [Marinicella gelatinilytica]|uniref:cell division protein FtsX n=1 Tax=Marinicella gelatinilytica TaxID=2996017 RepID=UPI002260D046|nr:permease-like cell division protein FtsX [Marinicella gelatinilytica]MCX7545178.1 permease-like cell division protein FtsX [Marinicella gelatinilytica]
MNQTVDNQPNGFKRWYRGHGRAIMGGWRMPMHTPYSSLFTVITLAICFYLPLLMWTLWQNFDGIQQQWQNQGSVAVFLKPNVGEQQRQNLQAELTDKKLISKVVLVAKQDIKSDLSDDPQLNQVIAVIDDYDLPDQLMLTPHEAATVDQLKSLAKQLQLHPDIDYVSFDADWYRQLQAVTRALYYVMQGSIAIFLTIVLVFLSHSIGNEVAAHKAEISLKKLLGASPGQIRRRFLYSGLYYGVLAGLLAWLLLVITLWWMKKPLMALTMSFGRAFEINAGSMSDWLIFITLCAFISWLGARISSSGHIHKL